MKAWWSSVLCALLITSAPVLAKGGPHTSKPELATNELKSSTFSDLDRIFEEWRRSAHVPGLVYGVVAGGKLVHVQGFGTQEVGFARPITAESLFRIASMSKGFTALAILKLRDAGKLSLDAPAENYVPELRRLRYPTQDSAKITVRELLNHSAGFVEDNPWGDRQQVLTEPEFTAMLAGGVPFSRAPGLAMEYSNFGYATLGRIISNVSNEAYQSYIRREIMAPLGMGSSGYDIFASPEQRRAIGYRWQDNSWVREPDMKDGAFGAMGGIQTSANDYAKWVSFLLSAWPARDGVDQGPIARATVREIVTGSNFARGAMRDSAVGGTACRQAVAYGMGWGVIDDCDLGRVVTHTGGYPGYGSVVMLLPDAGVGIFAFANRTYGAPRVPAFRAALAIQKAGGFVERRVPVSTELETLYQSARAVWRTGEIGSASLASNMLLDRDAVRWRALIAGLKAEVGNCPAEEAIMPISAMEGRFSWSCDRGRINGRVQRAPTPQTQVQALEFSTAVP